MYAQKENITSWSINLNLEVLTDLWNLSVGLTTFIEDQPFYHFFQHRYYIFNRAFAVNLMQNYGKKMNEKVIACNPLELHLSKYLDLPCTC